MCGRCLKSWVSHTLTTRGTRMPFLCAKLLAVLSALFASCKKSAKRPRCIPSETKMVNLLLKILTACKQMESQNKTTHIKDTAIIWLLHTRLGLLMNKGTYQAPVANFSQTLEPSTQIDNLERAGHQNTTLHLSQKPRDRRS